MTVNVVKEECFLDEILREFPNRVAKPKPTVKGSHVSLSKFLHQISDSLKDIQLQYTCVDVSSVVIALGTNVGNVFIYQRNQKKILKISSDTKYIPATCIKLGAGCGIVAFGHETGSFSVGLVEPPAHKSFDSLTTQDIHHSAVTCLAWSTDGLILYTGDARGKISLSVVKISEAILQTAVIVSEGDSIVQLSYASDALLASTTKRTILWSFQTENITQVGEKERKTSGSFGCCFLPENMQEPSKKLYTARPGQRIWAADSNGKVSSTSEFKLLLADKPQPIYTLTGNDKVNSGGQFGQLLIFYEKFITTWDQNHLWILDLQEGAVVACHSNLGKIRDVAVSGHEVFVLVNQRERFLRRFTLVTESLPSFSLDAVVAVHDNEVAETLPQFGEKSEERKTDNDIVLPVPTLKTTEDKASRENTGPPVIDIFQKINSIPVDDDKCDIVFTAAKKKKKKKVKQAVGLNEKKTPSEEPGTLPQAKEMVSPSEAILEKSVSRSETPVAEVHEKTEPQSSSNITMDDLKETSGRSHECSTPEVEKSLPVSIQNVGDEFLTRHSDQLSAEEKEKTQTRVTDKALIHSTKKPDDTGEYKTLDKADNSTDQLVLTTSTQKSQNDVVISAATSAASEVTSALSEKDSLPPDVLTSDKQTTEPLVPDTANLESSPINDSGVSIGFKNAVATPSRQELTESTDVYRILDESSNYLQNESYETEKSESYGNVKECSTDREDRAADKDLHVPLFADTWSSRALPTTLTIESLAISWKYVFCVDARGEVYYSDPGTASCHGWEQVNWKATQVCINSSCDLISYVTQGNKAFIRGSVSTANPVGNKSFHILDEVSFLSTCSVCTWAIMTNGELKRTQSSTLLDLKGDVKNTKIWRKENAIENLCQCACYSDVVWARTQNESLSVYAAHSSGKNAVWKEVEEKKAKWIDMSDDGTVWIITPDDQIWFNPGVSASSPTGEVWYQVTLGQYIIDDASILGSTFSFFQNMGSAFRSARTTEYLCHAAKGLLQSTKDMACSLFRDGGCPKQIYCNTHSGVWLLDTKNTLHACRSQVTGAYWKRISPAGTAKSALWRHVSTGLGDFVWALQPNGELTCFNPNGPSYNVEGPTSKYSLDFISSSPHGVWGFAREYGHTIYNRDGISESYPQGFAWTSLTLKHQEIKSVKHLSVGGITVWAVDNSGNTWVRIGSVNGDGSTVLSQAWLAMDAPANAEMSTVEVNSKDTMVWATDTSGNVYARDGVRDNFLVGSGWREVSGVLLKSVCLSSCVVYGLCTNGEVVCRFGVSPANCIGDYWKKIPGEFTQMSVTSAGVLWGISQEERLFVRKTKCLLMTAASNVEQQDISEKNKLTDNADGHDEDDENEDGDWELL